MAAILAWFRRNDSNLKGKLLSERSIDNMFFSIAVIRVIENKFLKKNFKVETLFFGKSVCDKSDFLRYNKT